MISEDAFKSLVFTASTGTSVHWILFPPAMRACENILKSRVSSSGRLAFAEGHPHGWKTAGSPCDRLRETG